MIFTTTSVIENKPVAAYLGVICGEAVLGVNVFKDLFASITDIVGGRSQAYEQELERARTVAFEDLETRARELGADAVIGIDIDYEVVGKAGSMMLVSISGTAVRLQ